MASASKTARARVRSELTTEIKTAASTALARDGAVALSLRAVARELDMAPSALYRYFASRDDLLTELIVDAYNSLADALEAAIVPEDGPHDQWTAVARAMRRWAFERAHEWALLYGSPVPGYRAPGRTIPAAMRIPRVLAGIVEQALADGSLGEGTDLPASVAAAAAVAPILDGLPTSLPAPVAVRTLAAWEQLSGAISLELFGHLTGGLSDPAAMYEHIATATAARIGLDPSPA